MRTLVSARRRILTVFGVGVIALAATLPFTSWTVAPLVGWDVASAIYLTWVWTAVWGLDGEQTAAVSTREDDSRPAAEVILIAASVASLVGVGFVLIRAADQQGATRISLAAFAVLSVVLSWMAVQTVFTLRYARLYHGKGSGIDFREKDRLPDYHDFAYVAFTIGMTFQVSDTDLTSFTMRRTALRHSLLSYLFGIVIIAITINLVAGLLR
jgi:uncharacterized membrane protein